MMKHYLVFGVCLLVMTTLVGQQRIDGTIDFQTDPQKAYSLYIPSNYQEGSPVPAFLALHPWNTSRWNAMSWRDTLSTFAEKEGVILIAPDGGLDGKVDDPIDTAFATFLLDSMQKAYDIYTDSIYAIGFSWGARTLYTYGLSNTDKFAGFIPIGAAVNGTREMMTVLSEADKEKFFIIHGDRDNPNVRFFPPKTALTNEGACVRDTLMSGVGHTIDFPGRNALISEAYEWVRTTSCRTTSTRDVSVDVVETTILSRAEFQHLSSRYKWEIMIDINGQRVAPSAAPLGLVFFKNKNSSEWGRLIIIP